MPQSRRKVFFVFIACLFCFSTKPTLAQTDAKAKSVLDAMAKKVSSLKSMKADFVLNLTGGKVKDTKKGNISIKGEKYHVVLAGQEIICDNKTVWTYNKEAKEVQVANFSAAEQTISPAKLLTGSYEKEYTYAYKGEKKEKGKTYEVVELTPTDKTKKVSKIELKVDKATSMVASGNIWEKNGTQIQYIVSNFVQNPSIPDAFFMWEAKEHPGVELVDLR